MKSTSPLSTIPTPTDLNFSTKQPSATNTDNTSLEITFSNGLKVILKNFTTNPNSLLLILLFLLIKIIPKLNTSVNDENTRQQLLPIVKRFISTLQGLENVNTSDRTIIISNELPDNVLIDVVRKISSELYEWYDQNGSTLNSTIKDDIDKLLICIEAIVSDSKTKDNDLCNNTASLYRVILRLKVDVESMGITPEVKKTLESMKSIAGFFL